MRKKNMKERAPVQQLRHIIYPALDAIGMPIDLDFEAFLTPYLSQFVQQCWDTWGDFESLTLQNIMRTASFLEASFAACLFYFQDQPAVISHSDMYLHYPNKWVRWPLLILLANQQVEGIFEALCQFLPEDLTEAEFMGDGLEVHIHEWRRTCLGHLLHFRNPDSVPYIQQALYTTVPWAHYQPGELPYDRLSRFHFSLIAALYRYQDISPFQRQHLPLLFYNIWCATWVAFDVREIYDASQIRSLTRHPEIQKSIQQGLKDIFSFEEAEQEEALQAFMAYKWNWLIYPSHRK
jgi:hypothetical protein